MKKKKVSVKRKHPPLLLTSAILLVCTVIIISLKPIWFGSFVKQNGLTYFEKSGKKLKGLQTVGFSQYYFNTQTGAMETGFKQLKGGTVYFEPSTGRMAYGLQKIDGYTYYFTANGTDNAVRAYEAIASNLKSNNTIIEKVISNGLSLVEKSPYDYGGGRDQYDIDHNKFDCSSFVAYMFRKSGKPLVYQIAASTSLLEETGTSESWSDKARGDLLITPSTDDEDELHVAIYLGGAFILHDSASTDGVNISRINQVIDPSVFGSMTWAQLFEPGYVQREV